MSLDATKTKLTQHGTVTIGRDASGRTRIIYEGFKGDACTCRDVAVLAGLWAIGELQREVMLDVQAPGGGRTAVG